MALRERDGVVSGRRPAFADRSKASYLRQLGRRATATWPRTVVSGFVATRLVYFALGVRFDVTPVRLSVMQLLDPELLRHDLLGSVWYLHSQPPLYNLVVGAYLHLPTALARVVGPVVAAGLGLALVYSIFRLLAELGISERGAAIAALAFAATPASILWENLFFYTYFVAAGLVASAALLLHHQRTGRAGALFGFFALLGAVALTRASYHLVWLVAVAAFVFVISPGGRRRVLIAAVLPVLLVAGWYVKNAVVFGNFSSSSWLGLNMAHATFSWMNTYELRELVDRGVTSDLVLVQPFSPKSAYVPRFTTVDHWGVKAVDQRYKSTRTWGLWAGNFNNIVYLRIEPQYRDDVWRFIRAEPGKYAHLVTAAGRFAFLPADHAIVLEANARHIRPLVWSFDRLVNGSPTKYRFGIPSARPRHAVDGRYPRPSDVGWFLLGGYVMVLVGGPVLSRRRRRAGDPAGARTILYLWAMTAYIVVVGIILETGENNRLRFEADPMAFVLGVVMVAELVRWRASRAAGDPVPVDAPPEP